MTKFILTDEELAALLADEPTFTSPEAVQKSTDIDLKYNPYPNPWKMCKHTIVLYRRIVINPNTHKGWYNRANEVCVVCGYTNDGGVKKPPKAILDAAPTMDFTVYPNTIRKAWMANSGFHEASKLYYDYQAHQRALFYSLRREEYNKYMRTPEWQEKRRLVRSRSKGLCEQCGGPGKEVHHLTYDRFGHEHLDDLQMLCTPCHSMEHPNHPLR